MMYRAGRKFALDCKGVMLIVGLVCVAPSQGWGQQLASIAERADQQFSRFNFYQASKLYENLLAKNPRSLKNERKIIACYQHLRNYANWLAWSAEAVKSKEATDRDRFYYAQALQSSGQYEAAKTIYQKIKPSFEEASLRDTAVAGCEWAARQPAATGGLHIKRLGTLNSSYAEFSPVVSGDSLFFISDRPNMPNEKKPIDVSEDARKTVGWTGNFFLKTLQVNIHQVLGGDALGEARPKWVRTTGREKFHQGPFVIDKSGSRMYFTRTVEVRRKVTARLTGLDSLRFYQSKGNEKRKRGDDVPVKLVHRLEIWYSERVNGEWMPRKALLFDPNSRFSYGHPALSPDGKILYFTSDMPGGKGGFDLYYCEIKGDHLLTAPVNITRLNTCGDDEFPSIGPDEVFYFATNGRSGFGGLDLFSTRGERDRWSIPNNLGRPINSDKDDFAMCITDETGAQGLFSTNREGGKGGDDILSFQRVRVKVNFVFIDNRSGRRIPQVGVNVPAIDQTTQSTDDGKAALTLDSGRTYNIVVRTRGYRDAVLNLPLNDPASMKEPLNVFLDSINASGTARPPVKTYTVYYKLNRFTLQRKAKRVLAHLLSDVKSLDTFNLKISSFADPRGRAIYNLALSHKRSNSVIKYLKRHGIAASKLQAAWFGDKFPINRCKKGTRCSEAEYQLNRRSDISVLTQE